MQVRQNRLKYLKTDTYKFSNIEYSNKYGAVEKAKSIVNVRVQSAHIPEKYDKNGGEGNLQMVFIEQIADIMMLATLDKKNCYHFDRKSSIFLFCKDKLCNAPDK
jgi:hypothetical protein